MAATNHSRTRKPDPKRWTFSKEDRDKYAGRFWKAPRRLVKAEREGSEEPGLWARLWREEGTTRGGGAATSVLPVLALHTWPGKKNMDGANVGKDAEPGWTAWTYLSRRRTAGLAGVNKDTVGEAFRRLTAAGLMETKKVPRAKYEGGYRTFYRLSAELYAEDGDYAAIPANLFYGGTWFMLPTNAARHLYVALACLDPITDEAAYLAKIEADHPGGYGAWQDNYDFPDSWWERYDCDDIEALQKILFLGERARRPLSLSELGAHSGLKRGTLIEALKVLTTPIFGDQQKKGSDMWYPPIAMIAKGNAEPGRPTWYAPDRRAVTWFWKSEFLNDPTQVEQTRRQNWPQLERRRSRTKRLARKAEELTPWREAQQIADLRRQLYDMGRDTTQAELARLAGKSLNGVSFGLQIATKLTPDVVERARVTPDELNQLSRNALYQAARLSDEERRAKALRRAADAIETRMGQRLKVVR